MKPFIKWLETGPGFVVRGEWDDAIQDFHHRPTPIKVWPQHKKIFRHTLTIDPETGRFPYGTIIYSCPKKSGKTVWGAAIGAWYAAESYDGTEIYVLANDREQAQGRMMKAIQYDAQKNLDMGPDRVHAWDIQYPNGTFIQALASHYTSAAGGQQALTLWDELWGYHCVPVGTPILRDDLRWVAAEELQIGDGLIAFEEERSGYYRSWRHGRVVKTGIENLSSVRIMLPLGQELVTTPDHRWLGRRGKHNGIEWLYSSDLRPGDQLMRVLPVWDSPRGYIAGYLAGAYDGEGSLTHNKDGGIRLDFSQKDNEMWEKTQAYLDIYGFSYYKHERKDEDRANQLVIGKKAEALRLLGLVQPKRLLSKLDIDRLGRMTAIEWVEVQGVEDAGIQPMVTLGTDTKTYIANGYAAHNTEKSIRLWEEMTLVPTEKLGLQVVVTYAGFENESHLLWDLYQKTVINGIRLKEDFPYLPCYTDQTGTIFTYWDHEPRMPWQTPEYYEQQMVALRPVNFRRLHLNLWGASEDEFIPIELWDKAEKIEAPLVYRPDSQYYQYPISVGVDVGVRRDSSAVVGVYYHRYMQENESGNSEEVITLGLAFHRIWKPRKGEILDLENTVEAYLKEMNDRFTIVNVSCDPTHFYRSMVTLQHEGLPIQEFKQTIPNLVAASTALYESLRFGTLQVYPDAELRAHIQFAAAKAHGSGFRIIKNPDQPRPNDGAIALSMAIYDAISRGGEDTSQEQLIRSPYSDCTAYPAIIGENEPAWLPEQLRG